MNRALLTAAALFLATIAGSTDAQSACPADCESSRLCDASVRDALPRLMREQNLSYSSDVQFQTFRRDLDGDPSTEEALINLVSPHLCAPTLSCPTLVVVSRGGFVYTIGSGRLLTPLKSTYRGWFDLGEQEPTLFPFRYAVTRVVRFDGLRYR
jgi:hypothetical protein